MKVSKTSRGRGRIVSEGAVCGSTSGWEGMMGGGWLAPSKKKPDQKAQAIFFFFGVGGPSAKKKRQQARELELFFLSPRILLARAPRHGCRSGAR